ncbi:MAG TPA: phosphopantetheine-binding protein [Opitutaceae bacterium]|nr:phosphopantetheine-binding protein [Opitutaceae bacterium]
MAPVPPPKRSAELARFPAEVLEAYQRYRLKGDAGAVEAVVIAAAVDYRPAASPPARGVSDETRLVEDLGYDSVAVAELVFFLEDLFEMTITNEDILAVRTIGDLRACVIRKVAAKTGAS